jgi:hypothetical protein
MSRKIIVRSRFMWLYLTLLSICTFAGTTVTETVGRHELRNAAGVMIGQYDSHAACLAAIPAPTSAAPLRYTCKAVTHIDVAANCDGVAKPALATFTVMDENVVVYKGPYCAPGETCTPPPPDDRSFVYTDVGGLRVLDNGTTEELKLVNVTRFPTCWEWQWLPQATATPVTEIDPDGFVPNLAPDALDGERQS